MLSLPILNVRLAACSDGWQQVRPRLWPLYVLLVTNILCLNGQLARAQTSQGELTGVEWKTAEDLNPTTLAVDEKSVLAPIGALPTGKIICWFGEQMPQFPGGVDSMKAYLRRNLRYPRSTKSSGKVFVSFLVTKTGAIRDARVMKGITPALDGEALRVVRRMPPWIPGAQNKQPVDVSYTIPVTFSRE